MIVTFRETVEQGLPKQLGGMVKFLAGVPYAAAPMEDGTVTLEHQPKKNAKGKTVTNTVIPAELFEQIKDVAPCDVTE